MKQRMILLLSALTALGLTACAPLIPADAPLADGIALQTEQTAASSFAEPAAEDLPAETTSVRVTFTVDAPVLAPAAEPTELADPVPEPVAETTLTAAETAATEVTETEITAVTTEKTEPLAHIYRDFGSSIWLAKEFESEPGHYYLFYGDGSGASRDPETWTPIPFTYEMESADCAMFHFCSADDMSPAGVHWLSDTAVQLTWHSGTVLTLNYVQAYDPDFQP